MILTDTLLRSLSQTNLKPIIAMEIDGVPQLYTSSKIKRKIRYGDPGIAYGDPGLLFGTLAEHPNQSALISLDGTTTSIKQTLEPDKARSSGVSQMSIVLIDKAQEATRLAAGVDYGEIIFKKVKIWLTFGDISNFNEDFILIFRGVIESVKTDQGRVTFNINSPDQKKRQLMLPKSDLKLDGAITNSQTSILLDSVENLLLVPDHPDYSTKDTSIKTYVRIDDEIIKFTGITGTTLTGCVRGDLGTVAVLHADEASANSFYKLEGNVMDLALKVMLSDGLQTPYLNLNASSVNIAGFDLVDNSIYVATKDFTRDYNINIGDWVKTSGFTETSNNISTWTRIEDVVVTDKGSYIILNNSVTLVYETPATGQVSFLSQYNTLGFGLKMDTDEVDIERHTQLRSNFVSNVDMRFYIRNEIEDGKEFIESELYRPAGCYPLPIDREGLSRVSIGIHKPPLPNQGIITLSVDNIIKPETLSVSRSSNKNYYNAVLFRYEDFPLDEKFYRKVFSASGTQAIPTGNKPLIVDSKGLKKILSADIIATQSANRLLERYQNAAEFMQNIQVSFADGIQITVGDIVILDGEGLNLVNRVNGSRDRPSRLMEVVNRSVDIKTGKITLDLIDTAFDVTAKYGLISATSLITSVISQKKFVIGPKLAGSKYGTAEYRKWQGLKKPAVKIRNSDFSLVFETIITKVSFNTIELRDDVSFTLTSGMFLELANYSNVDATAQVKLIYGFLSDGINNFPDGEAPYVHV